MTQEQFHALVGRLEEQARRHPFGYKLRVLLLALFGYGYLGAMLLILLAAFAATLASVVFLKAVAIKLIIPMGAFLWVVLRALWVRFDPPEGTRLTRRDAPELFALVDDLRRRLKAPRFHRVLITNEFNAGVVQVPRLGLLGWYRNYLLIGLPLMKSLTPAQFKAVLAHEFGHLAGGHGRLSNWLYRMRLSWARLMQTLDAQKSAGSFLFRPFFDWFAPYFNAYSFPLARANEYEADAAAARLESPRALAEALTAVNVVGSYLRERYWPAIHHQADDLPRPAFAPYTRLGESLAAGLEDADAKVWLEQAMAARTDADDTHPCLADRLQALGETARMARPAPGQAADRLLGDSLARLTGEFDKRWQDNIRPSWENRHQEVQQARAKLAELDARATADGELSLQDTYDRAHLTESYGAGADAALEQFRALHERVPDNPTVSLDLGERLLLRGDETGIALLTGAMDNDPDLIVAGARILRDHYWRNDREDEAHAWHARMEARTNLVEAAQAERAGFDVSDKLERHGLPDEAVADLRRQLQALGGVKRAWLVRKQLKHLPEHPCYVLGYTTAIPWWRMRSDKRAAEIQQRILDSVAFPGETLVFNAEGDNRRFRRKLSFRRGSRIL